MEKITLFKNAKLVMPYRIIPEGFLCVCGGKIIAVGTGGEAPFMTENTEVVDCKGLYLAPGFIDIHTHGCAGFDFMDGTADAYLTCAREYAKHGVTLVYPTITTGSHEDFAASLGAYEEAKSKNENGAAFGGLHLEGPYFSYEMRGAQDPRYLKNPVKSEYSKILESSPDIKRWSAAPELEGGLELGRELRSRGILAAFGHTDGTFSQLMEAYENGYTHMTHFYSAMSTIRRINAFRYSGAVELGYMTDEITLEIIADGVHLPQDLLRQIFKFKPKDKICLVTDSMRGAGLPEGTKTMLGSINDGQEVIIEDGVAKLADRSAFAGSVATQERLIRVATGLGGLELTEAVRMATANPARIMGAFGKGVLSEGYDADIVIFDGDINVKMTFIGQKAVYKSEI